MSESCTVPFCEEPATDTMTRFYPNRTVEANLCRNHAKQFVREFSKKGLDFATGPVN